MLEEGPDEALSRVMNEIVENRLSQLDALIGKQRVAEFCDDHNLDPSYISQLRTRARSFGEKAARRIELSMDLPVGTLDIPYLNGGSQNESTFGDRVRVARQYANLSQVQLAEACGWESQSRISGYERDEREPRREDILAIAGACNVAPAWLYFGEGAMTTHSMRTHSNLTDRESAIVEVFRCLTRSKQNMAMRILACID
jgi:transcriptional regulator with XRE-family HTH domain